MNRRFCVGLIGLLICGLLSGCAWKKPQQEGAAVFSTVEPSAEQTSEHSVLEHPMIAATEVAEKSVPVPKSGKTVSNPDGSVTRHQLLIGDPEDLYALGVRYLDGVGVEKNDIQGFEMLREAARKNHADSKYRLALCYDEGIGTAKSAREASHWMISAAQQDHTEARNWLENRGIFLDAPKRSKKTGLFGRSG